MSEYYMGLVDVAHLLGVSANTVRAYHGRGQMPDPDVIITQGAREMGGWKRETILEWHRARPGRGRWAASRNRENEDASA